jgi:hypothetical protein
VFFQIQRKIAQIYGNFTQILRKKNRSNLRKKIVPTPAPLLYVKNFILKMAFGCFFINFTYKSVFSYAFLMRKSIFGAISTPKNTEIVEIGQKTGIFD